MCKFKQSFICDVCGKQITYPNFRIEWGYNKLSKYHQPYDFIQVCHEDCSYGIMNNNNGHPVTIGDIIFDQLPYPPDVTLDSLNELSKDNPLLVDKIEDIKHNIFD